MANWTCAVVAERGWESERGWRTGRVRGSGTGWEPERGWRTGRVRASGTGGQPGGIGLSGLGQRCGERIANCD
ncbi:MAG: hypothetical protein HFH34_14735 [Eubacterium sp.]|nr:hypothetical protein [Eubacterium sp.]